MNDDDTRPGHSADIEQRLEELRAEYERGTQVLERLQAEAQETRDQLLRIAGAIRVCEELLGEATDTES